MTQKEHTQITQKTSSEIFLSLPEKIRFHRTKKGLSQETLAELLGISRQAVAKWESGAARPSTDRLIALCKIFEISPGELTGQTGSGEQAKVSATFCEAAPGIFRKKRPFFLLLLSGGILILTFSAVAIVRDLLETQNMQHYIGYADTATEIFVTGLPLPLLLLFSGGLLLTIISLALLLKEIRKFSKKPKKKDSNPRRHFSIFLGLSLCLFALGGCGILPAKETASPEEHSPSQEDLFEPKTSSADTASDIIMEEIHTWPENSYTSLVPKPSWGTPFLSTYSASQHFFAVTFHTAARQEGEDYIHLLRDNGFSTVDRNSEKVSTGEVLENAQTYVSVAVSDNTFAVYIRPKTNG